MKGSTTKQAFGLILWIGGILEFGLVYLNTEARRRGGHDLTPLLYTASLMMIGGFGLIFPQRWAKLVSSILLAASAVWSTIHGFLVLGMVPQMLLGTAIDCALCIPLFITVRGLMKSNDKTNLGRLTNAN
jgi:hypothetical protein